MVIRRIAPLPAAKIAGLIYAVIGLPFAVLIWVISLVGLYNAGLYGSPFAPFGMVGGTVALITMPIVYGFVGFVMTLTGAWLYNIMAGFVGGLSIAVDMDGAEEER